MTRISPTLTAAHWAAIESELRLASWTAQRRADAHQRNHLPASEQVARLEAERLEGLFQALRAAVDAAALEAV